MYVESTLHAALADVCVVSRLSAAFISLHVDSHFASRAVAAVPRLVSAVCQAMIVAWALDAVALSPLHPAAAWAALHPFAATASAGRAAAITNARLNVL
jgi:hypothetical protein